MTNPRDDLMALVTALQNADWPDVSIGNKALIRNAIERLTEAASRPATQVVDREAVARLIVGPRLPVPSWSQFTLEQLQKVRWGSTPTAEQKDALNAADAILSLLRPAEPVEAERPDTVAQRTWFDGENIRTENLTADDIYQKPTTERGDK